VILVDTSIWIDHFRRGNPALCHLLEQGAVVCHPFVTGELICGNLAQREKILSLLAELPQARVVTNQEALAFLEIRNLSGRGLGWVDINLLASALLMVVPLWTRDRALAQAAGELGISWEG